MTQGRRRLPVSRPSFTSSSSSRALLWGFVAQDEESKLPLLTGIDLNALSAASIPMWLSVMASPLPLTTGWLVNGDIGVWKFMNWSSADVECPLFIAVPPSLLCSPTVEGCCHRGSPLMTWLLLGLATIQSVVAGANVAWLVLWLEPVLGCNR